MAPASTYGPHLWRNFFRVISDASEIWRVSVGVDFRCCAIVHTVKSRVRIGFVHMNVRDV